MILSKIESLLVDNNIHNYFIHNYIENFINIAEIFQEKKRRRILTQQNSYRDQFQYRARSKIDLVGWHGNQRDSKVTEISCTLIQRYDTSTRFMMQWTIYRFLPRACHLSLSLSLFLFLHRPSFLCPTSRLLLHYSKEYHNTL